MLVQISKNEEYNHNSRKIYKIYENELPKIIAYILQRSTNFSFSMKKSVRPLFSLLLLVVVAATFGCRVAIRTGFGSVYGGGYGSARFSENGFGEHLPIDFPIFNSTLLKLAEFEVGEVKTRKEIEELLEGNFGNPSSLRTFATWRRFFNSGDIRARMSRGMSRVNARSPEFSRVWREFRRCLRDWSRKSRFHSSVMEELVDQVKVPIDRHNRVSEGKTRKYSSCAVVGNSGILLSKEYGGLIDSHEAVIRLNNARIEAYQKNVGSKTSMSFVNSNILHLCARRGDCYCHPYGANVPIVMYMCQPAQFLDYVVCSPSHKSPLIVTDRAFDMLCSRIVKYYSLKRFFTNGSRNKSLEAWNSAHDGSMFHYSSGMQAVTLALGICDQVSLFGFGKSTSTKHHYHTNQKKELSLHDYEAEYDFYDDLVKKPHSIPFFPEKFKFPPVLIHR
ncbi:hypothetical protein RND81_04G147400 [Saponaria officinalis]|uniref:Uncharacterized protein n=1 Tax=Saponaria officinalis TaxID=3572 RepID=A0AAW1LLU0_SAPOF